ncbi:hypothetical protein [Cupriavidus sp. CuC1]|uniref:hypothetical protein n=1 Tax=Cupriavidus sp. CuC1 TaxID=3373131 RepID=UPI0037D82676
MSVDVAAYRASAIRFNNAKIINGLLVSWLVVCVCFSAFNRDLLPRKYFYDSGHIASLFGRFNGFIIGDSYSNTALFYDLFLLAGNERIAAIITIIIFSIFSIKCFSAPTRVDLGGLHNVLIFFFSCLVGAIYLAQYSKESLVMLVAFLFFLLSNSRRQQVLWFVLVCAYAAYFRTYWFLVLLLYFYYRIAFKISRSISFVLLSIVVAFLALSIIFHGVLGIDLAYYRYSVNEVREYDVDAQTMIKPLLPIGNPVLEWANGVIQFFLMFFPFPLLTGNIQYFIFFLVTSSLGVRLFLVIKSSIAARYLSKPTRENRCLALIVAFVTIQSIFEPDYGSYIKHLTPMLPLVLYCFCWHQQWQTPREIHA